MTKVFNRHEAKDKRQALRKASPPAEVILWQRLRGGQLSGWKFRRQYSVGAYVVDFYCPRVKLALELDGPSHEGGDATVYDANRQALIESYDICFLRFTNEQVYHQLNAVLETIACKAQELRQTCGSIEKGQLDDADH